MTSRHVALVAPLPRRRRRCLRSPLVAPPRRRAGLSRAPGPRDRAVLAGRRGRRADAHHRAGARQALNQQVIVENKPGAGATIGTEIVAKAAPDGYTLLLASQTNAISASLYKMLTYDPIEDFAPISLIGREPGVLVVHPSLPVKSFAEFVAYVKERPGKLDYASSGNGSGQHLFMALLLSSTSLQMTHIPYKGSGQATADLLGGQVIGVDSRHGGHGRPHQGRQAAPARGDRRAAFAAAARRADGDGIRRAGLRSVRLDGPARAEGHAAADHRQAPSRADAGDRNARGQDVHGQRRHRDRRLHAGRVRPLLPRREGPVGEGRPRHRREGR